MTEKENCKPCKENLISLLDEMVTNIEALPSHAMINGITHYDLLSLLILLQAIFKCKDE